MPHPSRALFLIAVTATGPVLADSVQAITKGKVDVSCKLSKPALPDGDFAIKAPEIRATIDNASKRARASSTNGLGGSIGPITLDLSDVGHQSARVLINPSNGWLAISMTVVDAKTSDIHELKLYLQRTSDTAPYRILEVSHGTYNPVSSKGAGFLDLDVFIGKTCDVTMTGQ